MAIHDFIHVSARINAYLTLLEILVEMGTVL